MFTPSCSLPRPRLVRASAAVGALCAVLLAGFAAAAAAQSATHPDVEALLGRFKDAQASTRALSAAFRIVKEDELLAAPDVQSGRFFYTNPLGFRWNYEVPEEAVVVMDDERIQRWVPKENLVRESRVTRGKRRMFNLFGIGSDIDALREHFNVHWNHADASYAKCDKLELTGKRRRIQKRIKVLEMWIDQDTSLPTAVRIVMADGGSTTWEFTDVTVNPVFDRAIHDLHLPPGTRRQSDDGRRSVYVDDVIGDDDETTDNASGTPTVPAPRNSSLQQ